MGLKIDLFPMASAAVVGLDFGTIWDDFGVHVATILEPKIDTEASWKNIQKMIEKKSRGCLQVFAAGEGGSALTEIQWSLRVKVILEGEGR